MLKLPPLALYIHYPWCVKKCPYCDFNSHEKGDKSGYIQALLQDLDNDLKYLQNRQIYSIFIGGGTPSLMSIDELGELFSALKSRLVFEPNIEITLEANPGTFEIEKFKAFKEIGINRISIGVQSFNDAHLKFLGRIHNANEAHQACIQARKIFDNFNIDLMYGLQNQSSKQCLADLNQAIDLKPSHISFYQLSIEPNTLFAKFPPTLPENEDIWQMGEQGAALLEANGFARYEVSAFATIRSKHNLNYWQFGDYLGIGAGAHGKITNIDTGEIFRTLKPKSPTDYLKKPHKKVLPIENLAFDFMLNALRLKHGFSANLFEQTTGQSINSIYPKLIHAQNLALIQFNNKHITPTNKGYDFLNDLQQIFL